MLIFYALCALWMHCVFVNSVSVWFQFRFFGFVANLFGWLCISHTPRLWRCLCPIFFASISNEFIGISFWIPSDVYSSICTASAVMLPYWKNRRQLDWALNWTVNSIFSKDVTLHSTLLVKTSHHVCIQAGSLSLIRSTAALKRWYACKYYKFAENRYCNFK